jgi:hypothetical protein
LTITDAPNAEVWICLRQLSPFVRMNRVGGAITGKAISLNSSMILFHNVIEGANRLRRDGNEFSLDDLG